MTAQVFSDRTQTAPLPRGPVSEALIAVLTSDSEVARADLEVLRARVVTALEETDDLFVDEDLQLTLFLLYLLHYGPADFITGDWEWNPGLIGIRRLIEAQLEAALRVRVPLPVQLPATGEDVAAALFEMTADAARPTLATWAARNASVEQMREFLIQKSIYTLREADPHSWAIPRLRGRAKAALVEIQADEYGGGDPQRVHAEIFARTLRGFGLDDTPDAYLDVVPAVTLNSLNTMSFFGLNRRLRGAIVGHLAAFEMTSSIPNKFYSRAFGRHDCGDEVTDYFDEHVEADAVHEQIAGRDLAGGLADSDPDLIADIIFGASACLYVDDLVGTHMHESWTAGRSSLRDLPATP
ncbi:heme oxygenase-like protein [Brevibacterium sanguinis]|uniref:Heme oxygenase-like protein n=2 Tax=Brevibacterium TaxID=1696 RepID=A0A366IKY6_9MICO|nr:MULTISPECIES: iron-containing redox enzyme family protein [Brevibacterium]RBP65453.1 heme oxygenase-like protein [Brevibacterium sanguinis]RBP72087.1 heme oxygenase-like protein [Brevibacterium celere]